MPLVPYAKYVSATLKQTNPAVVLMDENGKVYKPGSAPVSPTPELLTTAAPLVLIDPATSLPYTLSNGSVASDKMVFLAIGDSLVSGATYMPPPTVLNNGFGFYATTADVSAIGGIAYIMGPSVEGVGPSGVAGTLSVDGKGSIRWQITGDAPGPWVDATQGGFVVLQSGTPGPAVPRIVVPVRGNTPFPTVAASGAITTSGIPATQEWRLAGHMAFMAGRMGETFDDYLLYAIAGSTVGDALKFSLQALKETSPTVVMLCVGVNNNPSTAAAANATYDQQVALLDFWSANAPYVLVLDTFPNPSTSQAVQKFNAMVAGKLRTYAKTKRNVRVVSTFDKMFSPSAASVNSAATARKGVYRSDALHLLPFGSSVVANSKGGTGDVVESMFPPRLYPIHNTLDIYDAAVGVGSINLNPGLRGTAGTVVANSGITGTAPDSWIVQRIGTVATLTTAFVTADDKGADWYAMTAATTLVNDYHQMYQNVSLPAGVVPGDSVSAVCEMCIMDCSAGTTPDDGLKIFTARVTGKSTTAPVQSIQVVQIDQIGQNIATFTLEKPTLTLRSRPMMVLPTVVTFEMSITIGAAVGGGGTIGFRNFRLEKVKSLTVAE